MIQQTKEEPVPPAINPIQLSSYRVNCYLVDTGEGFILIDSGAPKNRAELESRLNDAGCKPGNLRLITLTHADVDHSGNAAYLRNKYASKIAIHRGESGVTEKGPMSLSRGSHNLLGRMVLPFFKLSKPDRFKADLFLEDGDDLSGYGLEAKVLHLPGHSRGSIGILTSENNPIPGAESALFCGDLLTNLAKPELNSLLDDRTTAMASLERLRSMPVKTVYPGHGLPFPMELLIKNMQS
jgi:hydroxyacylglutathione hydrolase